MEKKHKTEYDMIVDLDITSPLRTVADVRRAVEKIGMKVCEIPVTRAYPNTGKTPTKISFFRGNGELLKILFLNLIGAYKPKGMR